MNENKKWGYIYDEKLNMYIPNLPRQRKNRYFFSCIICFIMMIFALSFQINKLLEVFSFEFITYLLFLIGMMIFSYINFLKKLKNRKYSLLIDKQIIKIYYENDEMEYIKTDNIDYVRFYSIRHGRKGRREKYPTLQIFDIEEKNLLK